MRPQSDGLSETSRALLRKCPLHISPGMWQESSRVAAAATSANHRADMNKALGFIKGQQQKPALDLAANRSIDAVSDMPRQERLSEQAATLPGSPQGTRISNLEHPPTSCLRMMLGYGDVDESEGFPGAPAASRGVPGGGHKKWSFERCPSLLPAHLARDRGQRGRSVAGSPPAASLLAAGSAAAMAPQSSAWHGTVIAAGDVRRSSPASLKLTMTRGSASTGHLHAASGLQGVIGTTWDNAKATAGEHIRGSDGRFLGY